MQPRRLPVLQYAVQIHPLSGLSNVHIYFLHHSDQILLLHVRSYGIRTMMSGKSELLLRPLPDPAIPVLREAEVSQICTLSCLSLP